MLSFLMTFATHAVRVTKIGPGEIRCWKYTDSRFDYEIFDNEESALEYITAAPPTLGWHVELHSEER